METSKRYNYLQYVYLLSVCITVFFFFFVCSFFVMLSNFSMNKVDYNSVPVKDNCVLFAPTPYFWVRAI